MKVLIVTQYFWPENFRINDIALGLIERGHKVEVLTGKPNYPQGNFYKGYSFFSKNTEIWKGIKIYRSQLVPRGNAGGFRLILNYLSFALFGSARAFFLKEKFDKILVYGLSPVTLGIPALVYKCKTKTPVYFYVQDLWPYSVTAAGGIKNPLVIGALEKLTRWIYKNCDKLLIQSEAFRAVLIEQKVEDAKIVYCPNSVENFFKPQKPDQAFEKLLPLRSR